MVVIIDGAFYAVDVFFFLGGFFSGFVLTKKLANTKIIHFPFIYITAILHRALRILPAYMTALFIYWKLYPFMGYDFKS